MTKYPDLLQPVKNPCLPGEDLLFLGLEQLITLESSVATILKLTFGNSESDAFRFLSCTRRQPASPVDQEHRVRASNLMMPRTRRWWYESHSLDV